MGLIAVAPDGQGFVEVTSGEPFVPFGTNYYDPNTGWHPKVWQQFDPNSVSRHFALMNAIGVNCARVFLTTASFQPGPDVVDAEALEKLDTLVDIARESGIRLLITGPVDWEGQADYWSPDRFAGEVPLAALEKLWATLGERYRGEPAILGWDLGNEPEMPWFVDQWAAGWNTWLQAKYGDRAALKAAWGAELEDNEALGTVASPRDRAQKDNPRLLDWQFFREHLADEWVRRQVEVLREVDPLHMITVGYIQWSYPVIRPGNPSIYSAFDPHRQAQWLDFISVHFYPFMGNPYTSPRIWDDNLAYLQTILAYCDVGKPVVLEEYGWYGDGAPPGKPYLTGEEQARWISAEIEASRRLAHGWLSWPFADAPEADTMACFGGMVTEKLEVRQWAYRFRLYASNLSLLPQPAPPLPALDFQGSLTTPFEELIPIHEQYAAMVKRALDQMGPMPEIKEEPPTPEQSEQDQN
jgi:hypothetical protein